MLDVFMHTPGAVTVTTTRRHGRVVHLTMAVTPPGAVLTWIGDVYNLATVSPSAAAG
jgi:hypothetical protein